MHSMIWGIALLIVGVTVGAPTMTHAQPQGLTPYQPAPPPPITGFPGLTQDQVRQIMENSRKIQDCLATQAKEPLKRVQERNVKNSKTLDALCEAGKREEAKETAERFGRELKESEDMLAIKKCTGGKTEIADIYKVPENSTDPNVPKHICDYTNTR